MMTLTETNAGGQDASVAIGCGVSDFWVTQGGAEVWRRSKDGPQPLCPISLGGVLHPRESRTFTATWDGHFNEASPPNPAGPFVFHGQVDGLTADAPTQTPLAVSLTTDRTAYQVGQPILMTLTETNTSDGDITVEFGPSIDGFFVIHDGVEVWRSNLGPRPQSQFIGLKTLHPGESFTPSATWDGTANEGPPTTPTGTFEVHSQVPGANTVAIRILPAPTPLNVSVTTDRGSYRVGQPVRITVTETNTGTEAVEVGVCGPDRVAVTRQGVVVWRSVDRQACIQVVLLLEPGQSRQFTVNWPGRFNEHLRTPKTGLFLIQSTLDGASGATTIRIGRR
jgi:hypothetical protein